MPKSKNSLRPRWSDDKLCYIRLLRLQGVDRKKLRRSVYSMELKEAHSLSLLSSKPVGPCLKDNNSPEIDLAWVCGDTCSDFFSCLTFRERWFLFQIFNEEETGMTSRQTKYLLEKIASKMRSSS